MKNRAQRAERLQQARIAKGLKQQDVADSLFKSLATIKKWESPTGAEPASLNDVVRLCDVYGISLQWYILGKKDQGTPLSKVQARLLSAYEKLTPRMQRRILKITEMITRDR